MPPLTLEREDVIAAVREALGPDPQTGFRHNSPGTPQATGYMHGRGGLFSYPGTDPAVFVSAIGTLPGVLNAIPSRGSEYTDPTFTVFSGQYGDNGSEKNAVCDPAPTPGLLKAGLLWAPFGRYARATPEMELGRMGQRVNRADPLDLTMVGSPTGSSPWPAEASEETVANMLVNEMQAALYRRNVSMHRLLTRQLWRGNPANNHGEAYMEFPGLELLVNTGNRDAVTGTLLPSVDPNILDFGHKRVDSNGDQIIRSLAYITRYVRSIASRSQVDPVRWVLAMREELFYELTSVWACNYMTSGCVFPAGQAGTLFVNSNDSIAMRDRLRRDRVLLIDGLEYEVVFDDGITERDGNSSGGNFPRGCFESDIFLLPMSVLGGTSVLFMEYFNFDNASIQQAAALLGGLARIRASGAFLEYVTQVRQCFQSEIEIKPRVILRTPWLAGRLKNVVYCPLEHNREPFPNDPYFVNGGETTRPGPSFYAGWKS